MNDFHYTTLDAFQAPSCNLHFFTNKDYFFFLFHFFPFVIKSPAALPWPLHTGGGDDSYLASVRPSVVSPRTRLFRQQLRVAQRYFAGVYQHL